MSGFPPIGLFGLFSLNADNMTTRHETRPDPEPARVTYIEFPPVSAIINAALAGHYDADDLVILRNGISKIIDNAERIADERRAADAEKERHARLMACYNNSIKHEIGRIND